MSSQPEGGVTNGYAPFLFGSIRAYFFFGDGFSATGAGACCALSFF